MSAGAIRAPLIIPLRVATAGVSKSHIDTNTRLEIISETPNVNIYFTVNGSRPVIRKNDKELLNTGTYRFRNPFTLPSGCQTVKAVALLPETGSESNVVTKTFDVTKASIPGAGDKSQRSNDYGFLDDLKAIEAHRRKSSLGSGRAQTREFVRQVMDKEVTKTKKHRTRIRRPSGDSSGEEDDTAVGRSRSPDLSESMPDQRPMEKQLLRPFQVPLPATRPMSNPLADPNSHLTRLQRSTDILRCPQCFQPRPTNQSQNFCAYCGHNLPRLPLAQPITPPSQSMATPLGTCQQCQSTVPLHLPTCLVCEAPLRPDSTSKDLQAEYRLCTICGTVNPAESTSCVACEARLPGGTRNLIHPSTVNRHHLGHAPQPAIKVGSNQSHSVRYPSNGLVSFLPCPHCRRENNPDARFCDWCGLETNVYAQPAIKSNGRSTADGGNPVHWNLPEEQGRLWGQSRPEATSGQPMLEVTVRCASCGTTAASRGQKFCSCCGAQFNPPTRDAVWNSEFHKRPGNFEDPVRCFDSRDTSVYTQRSSVVANVATQTVGLFYPSSADLRRQGSLTRGTAVGADTQLRDRMPLLTATSPGRGFWRKQLDHIVAHLKVYTTNSPEFRAAVGEPRMGKLLSAHFLDSSAGHATISLTFTLPNTPNTDGRPSSSRASSANPSPRRQSLSSVDSGMNRRDLGREPELPRRTRGHLAASNGWMKENEAPKREVHKSGRGTSGSEFVDRGDGHHNDDDDDDCDSETLMDESSREVAEAMGISLSPKHGSLSSEAEWESGTSVNVERPPSGKPRTKRNNNTTRSKSINRNRGNESARSRQSGSTTRSRRGGKKSQSGGHHGEAGVALLRQSKLSATDRNLIFLLSKSNDGDQDDLHRVLSEGANANCLDADGKSPLVLAVYHRKPGAIAALVEAGADVNAPGMLNGNTALHEAVLLGFDGVDLVDALLKCGASSKVKNKRDETAHALALRQNCQSITHLMLTHMGQSELQMQLNKESTRIEQEEIEGF